MQDSKRFWEEMVHTLPAFLDAPLANRARRTATEAAQTPPPPEASRSGAASQP